MFLVLVDAIPRIEQKQVEGAPIRKSERGHLCAFDEFGRFDHGEIVRHKINGAKSFLFFGHRAPIGYKLGWG